jgi:hypothetical protein
MSEFVQRCPQFNLLISTPLPSPQTSATAEYTNVTSGHAQLDQERQEHAAQVSHIDEIVTSFSSRLDTQNGLLSNRIDDCVSRLAVVQSQLAQQLQTQSIAEQHILQNIGKLKDSVVDLTKKVSESSNIKNEVDELRKSVSQPQPHSLIGFKPHLTTFQAVPAAFSLLDGVISYLTTRHGGNVHQHGIVTVFAGRAYSGEARCAAKNVADLKTDSYFFSVTESNQSIGYDFREMMRIIPTHYSVRSYSDGPGASHLRSWVFEVSNDGQIWEVVDRRTDCRDLNDKYAVQCFVCKVLRKRKFDMSGFARLV